MNKIYATLIVVTLCAPRCNAAAPASNIKILEHVNWMKAVIAEEKNPVRPARELVGLNSDWEKTSLRLAACTIYDEDQELKDYFGVPKS